MTCESFCFLLPGAASGTRALNVDAEALAREDGCPHAPRGRWLRDVVAVHRTVTLPTMPGWIAQWYGNVPAVCSATLNRPPGATLPEFHPWMSDVEVCATESVFVHVTVVPTVTFSSSGTKA